MCNGGDPSPIVWHLGRRQRLQLLPHPSLYRASRRRGWSLFPSISAIPAIPSVVRPRDLSYKINAMTTKCPHCRGARLRRVHRTFAERIFFQAAYECVACRGRQFAPRRFQYHLGSEPRCPKCGNSRITKLKERDSIDPMYPGILNLLERAFGRNLYHCFICRIQFYDRRIQGQSLNIQVSRAQPAGGEPERATIQPGTAKLDG